MKEIKVAKLLYHTILFLSAVGFLSLHGQDGLSGKINITLKNITHLCIGSSSDGCLKWERHPSSGQFVIPGSSLKGLVRNILSIVSFGKFNVFNDRTYSYREIKKGKDYMNEYDENNFDECNDVNNPNNRKDLEYYKEINNYPIEESVNANNDYLDNIPSNINSERNNKRDYSYRGRSNPDNRMKC